MEGGETECTNEEVLGILIFGSTVYGIRNRGEGSVRPQPKRKNVRKKKMWGYNIAIQAADHLGQHTDCRDLGCPPSVALAYSPIPLIPSLYVKLHPPFAPYAE